MKVAIAAALIPCLLCGAADADTYPPFNVLGTNTGPILLPGGAIRSQMNGMTAEQLLGPYDQNYDAVRGVAVETPGTQVDNTNGVAGYVMNSYSNSATAINSGANSVGIFGLAIADPRTTGSDVWGLNTITTDNYNGLPSDGGHILIGYEMDINNVSPNNFITGLGITGASIAAPSFSNAITIEPLNASTNSFPWSVGLNMANGCCTFGAVFPAASLQPNAIGAPVYFNYMDAGGQQQSVRFLATPQAGLAISTSSPTQQGPIATFYGPVQFSGSSGTPTSYACFTNQGTLIASATPCVSAQ